VRDIQQKKILDVLESDVRGLRRMEALTAHTCSVLVTPFSSCLRRVAGRAASVRR
jgi:hypothetical protein